MNKDRFKISYLKQYKSPWRVHRHSLTTFSYTPCKYSSGPRFALITDLISECIDSTTCWKHFSEFLLHIKMLSCLGCRIVGCTTIIHVLFNNISKVLYWIVIWWHWRPLEATWVRWSQFEMIWTLSVLSCWKQPPDDGYIIVIKTAILCKPWRCLHGKIPIDQRFLKYSDQPLWHHQPCHVHSKRKHLEFDHQRFVSSECTLDGYQQL